MGELIITLSAMTSASSSSHHFTRFHEMQMKFAKDLKVSKTNLYVTSSSISKAIDHHNTMLLMVFKEGLLTSSIEQELRLEVFVLLDKFKDVLPEEILAGLPHIRGIEHQIDLVPGAALPNRPAYRMNPTETKELEKQIQDLMSKNTFGRVLARVWFMSSWYLRKMELGECV